ncbi:hypothetical protein AB6A40_007524 [Gnathostoma spinigerum]|uniref:Uncharacterized protein n=1 Tax=Gnathostoma spinigerum TaxID=75299 RepID=A0ABD6EMP9_9BILA
MILMRGEQDWRGTRRPLTCSIDPALFWYVLEGGRCHLLMNKQYSGCLSDRISEWSSYLKNMGIVGVPMEYCLA